MSTVGPNLNVAPFLNKSRTNRDKSVLKEALDSPFQSASNELFRSFLTQELNFWRAFLQRVFFVSILLDFHDFGGLTIQTVEVLAGFTHIVQTSSVGTIIKI